MLASLTALIERRTLASLVDRTVTKRCSQTARINPFSPYGTIVSRFGQLVIALFFGRCMRDPPCAIAGFGTLVYAVRLIPLALICGAIVAFPFTGVYRLSFGVRVRSVPFCSRPLDARLEQRGAAPLRIPDHLRSHSGHMTIRAIGFILSERPRLLLFFYEWWGVLAIAQSQDPVEVRGNAAAYRSSIT